MKCLQHVAIQRFYPPMNSALARDDHVCVLTNYLPCSCVVVLAGVAGTAFSVSRHGATALVGVSDGAVLSIAIVGEYDDKPGQGYWFVDTARFVEPQRTSTVNIEGKSSTGAALSTCAYSTANANGATAKGPWDHIAGVETAKDFTRTGSTDTASFTVRYPSPAQYNLTVSCEYEDGEKALLETVSARTRERTHARPCIFLSSLCPRALDLLKEIAYQQLLFTYSNPFALLLSLAHFPVWLRNRSCRATTCGASCGT
jgi:hypothetical protein